MINNIKLKIKKILNFYRNAGIQYIISISFTLVAVIGVIVVGASFSIRFMHLTEKMVAENNSGILEQVNLNLDGYLRNMMKISDTTYYSVIKKADLAVDNIDEKMNLLYETNKDFLISICLFSEYGQVVSASPLVELKESVDPRQSEWFSKAINKRENLHFSTPHVQNLFVDPNYKYRWVVSLSRAVELTSDGKITQGVLLVDMNFSGIELVCKNVNLGKSGYVYLIDGEGEIIYHPRQQLIYSNLIEENNNSVYKYEDGSYIEEFEGEKRLITIKTVGYTGWKLVAITPMANIIADYYQIGLFTVFIILFAVFILTFINMYVSSKIANPIKELEKSVKELENGVFDVNISINGSHEVQHLGKTIKSMVNQMHILMDNIVMEQEAKRKSELNALQAQINPHFLYNTLDSIIWMIENDNYDGAIRMVTALARLFRISLSKGKNVITIFDELEHARNYLTIQSIRYKNKFTYDIYVKEEALNLSCIKLIIQPLLENAIYHGVEALGDDGEIEVKVYINDGDLYIDVIDNGLGMTDNVVEELLTSTNKVRGKGSGIGLKNVHDRIRLYFGESYGLKIYSEPDEGTTVRIHMPAVAFYDIKDKEAEIDKR